MRRRFLLAGLCFIPIALWAADPGPVITDAAGKEIVLTKWQISSGTRKLSWLAGAPDALVFRETDSTTYKDGVLTLIPLTRLESLTYDAKELTVRAKIAGVDKPISGWTRYTGINQFAIDAEIDKGAAGTVELKYRGGSAKGGIKAVKFPGAKPADAAKGDKLFVVISDGKKKEAAQPVHQVQALYKTDSGEKALSYLMFKKTFKVELSQLTRMTLKESDDQKGFECDVTLRDGSEQTLTLLTTITVDGKPASLEGLIAEVPAGYKLFPMHTIGEVSTSEPKVEKEPKKGIDD